MASCSELSYFENQENAHSTEYTFYDQNPSTNANAKSVAVQYEITSTVNIDSSYPKNLRGAFDVPTKWCYIDLQNPGAATPENVSVVGGEIQVYVTQRALSFYAEDWVHSHAIATAWSGDDANHWHAANCGIAGHNEDTAPHTWDVTIIKPATEASEGLQSSTCTVCGRTKTESIPIVVCDHTIEAEWSSDETYHWHIASCGIEAHYQKAAHKWNGGFVTTPATEAAEGERLYTCTVCTKTKTEVIPKLTHNHTIATTWTSDETNHWHAASCGIEAHNQGKATHTWNSGTVTTAATCTTDGVKTYTCTVCSKTKTETIPATGHTIATTWTTDSTYHWHKADCGIAAHNQGKAEHTWDDGEVTTEPTETTTGVKTYTCTVCGKTKTETLPKVTACDHDNWTWVGGAKPYKCGTCGSTKAVLKSTEVENYLKNCEAGSTAKTIVDAKGSFAMLYITTALKDSSVADIKVELELTGNSNITSIGTNAFWKCTNLTSITIPSSVTEIGDGAFEGCTSLTNITIPSSVTSIGSQAFSGCTSLASVTIPSSVTSIGTFAFEGCTSLTNMTIPSSVTSISKYAFYGCTSLTSVTIPGSVKSIGKGAFKDCSSLSSVTIEDGVESIGEDMFYGCSSLTSVAIPGSVTEIGNSAFEDCSGLTSITIPGSVTEIGNSAFEDCSGLTSITIPGSVTEIGGDAFYGCTSLESVTIPSTVTSIGSWAFYNVPNTCVAHVPTGFNTTLLTSAKFKGTFEYY